MKIDIEMVIHQVEGSMAIEGMQLSTEDKKRIRQTVAAPEQVETIVQELVKKHSTEGKKE